MGELWCFKSLPEEKKRSERVGSACCFVLLDFLVPFRGPLPFSEEFLVFSLSHVQTVPTTGFMSWTQKYLMTLMIILEFAPYTLDFNWGQSFRSRPNRNRRKCLSHSRERPSLSSSVNAFITGTETLQHIVLFYFAIIF